jgi:hypothetical protein
MFACKVYPRKIFQPLALETLLEALGITILAVALRPDDLSPVYGMPALTDVGTALRFMPGTLHGIGCLPGHISSVMSLILLSTSLGGIFATITLNIFNNKLSGSGIDLNGGSELGFHCGVK